MKNKLALALALIIPASFAFADEPNQPPQDGGQPPHHQRMGKEGFLNKMGQDLNLSDAQKANIGQIMSTSREETDSRIMEVLTPEQQVKFQEFKKRGPHGQGGPRGEHKGPKPPVDGQQPQPPKDTN